MATSLSIRCANDPKDFSLWDSHKDTFRQLFLADGLSLAAVKAKMEGEFGFPITNVKTYEVVLREHFKFRKKLEAGQWLLVYHELERLRQHGLAGDVYLSGKLLDEKHVSKNIRRERREFAGRRQKPNKPAELPPYVEIKPKASLEPPAAQLAEVFAGECEDNTGLMLHSGSTATEMNALMPFVEPLPIHQQALENSVFVMDEAILQQMIQNPIGQVYETLRENVPSKLFIKLFRSLLEGDRLSADEKGCFSSGMYGLLFMIINYKPSRRSLKCFLDRQSLPQPRLLGINDSVAFLEKACVQFSNMEHPITSFQQPIVRWISDVADLVLLRSFFRLQSPVVAALWSNIYNACATKNNKAAKILLGVALDIHRGSWLRGRSITHHLGEAIHEGDEDTTEYILSLWQTDIGYNKPPDLKKILWRCEISNCLLQGELLTYMKIIIRLAARYNISPHDLDDILGNLISNSNRNHVAATDWLIQVGVHLHPAISHWIPPCAQLLPKDWASLCGPTSFYQDDWAALYYYNGISARTPCSKFISTFVPAWGCVAAARSGEATLQQFVNSLDDDDYTPQERDRIKQVALSEVAGQGDAKTTALLLNIGVDPLTKLLPRVEWDANGPSKPSWCYLDPLSRAAVNDNLHILDILIGYGFYRLRHIVDALIAATRTWDPIQYIILQARPPVDIEKRDTTITFLLKQDAKRIWDKLSEMKAIPCQNLVLRQCQRQFDAQLLASQFQPSGLLYSIFPHGTFRNAVKYGFSLSVIESLAPANEDINSIIDANGNTLLIDALLSESEERYRTVQFLLRKGADPCVNGLRLTTLEASLWNYAQSRRKNVYRVAGPAMEEERGDHKISLHLFQELLYLGAPVTRDTEHQEPCPKTLLVLLIECHAELSLIQQVVAAGANINERHAEQNSTPLNTAVISKNLEVAEWLIKQGAEVNTEGSTCIFTDDQAVLTSTILINACWDTSVSFVQLLIKAGADVNASDGSNETPLKMAILKGDMDLVIALLSHGAKVNSRFKDSKSDSPVDLAASLGRLDILKVLLESGGGSIYPGISGFDKAFYNAYVRGHNGILMFLEQHTGWSASTVVSNLNALGVPKDLGWWRSNG